MWNKILDNLYIGDIFSLADTNLFKSEQIDCVITLNKTNFYGCATWENINHHIFEIEDKYDTDIISICKKCFDIINNHKTLIHCQAGKSRSGSIAIYYIMKKYNMSFNNSLNYVKNKHNISLNNGFYSQLKNL